MQLKFASGCILLSIFVVPIRPADIADAGHAMLEKSTPTLKKIRSINFHNTEVGMTKSKRQAQFLYQYPYPNLYFQPDGQMLSLLYPQMYMHYPNSMQGTSYQTTSVPTMSPNREVLITQYPPSMDNELINKLYRGSGTPQHLRPFGGRFGDRTDEELLRSLYKKPGPAWDTRLPGHETSTMGPHHFPHPSSTSLSPFIPTTTSTIPPPPSMIHFPQSTEGPPPPNDWVPPYGPPLLSPQAGSHIGRVPPRRLLPPQPWGDRFGPSTNYHAPEARITSFGHAIIHDNNH